MNIKLVKLSYEYKRHLADMMDEWTALEKDFSPRAIRLHDYHDFDNYLANIEAKAETEGRVPDSVFFCIDQDRDIFVGAVNIRHYLTKDLWHTGGHIGDGIRPGERRKGYATAMIGLALEECRKLGLNKVLMTCDSGNIGSAKSIMNNGGVFESEVMEDGKPEQRYWITLKEEVVETERLVMKREMPSDCAEAFEWCSDERVYIFRLANAAKNPEEVMDFLESADPNDRNKIIMLIRSRMDGHAIGTVGAFREDKDRWTVAYCIRHDDWGKGYTPEAVRALMDYVGKEYGARVFEAECAKENTASNRVAQKLGMKKTGESSYSKNDGSRTFESNLYRIEL